MNLLCPDCEAPVIPAMREVPLAEGESALVLDGRVVIATVSCSASCDAENAGESNEEIEACGKDGCDRPAGHTGRHRKPRPEEGAE